MLLQLILCKIDVSTVQCHVLSSDVFENYYKIFITFYIYNNHQLVTLHNINSTIKFYSNEMGYLSNSSAGDTYVADTMCG